MEPQAALSEVRAGERKGRIRELLAEYYTEDAQGHGLAARQESTDPCDLDGAAFDVDLYMEESMQGERMKQLLKKSSTIRGEVKTLDNDMQMLVYENYTKFISATDTIGQMKEGVEGMEDEMQSLAATITKISDGSNRINTNLSEHRAKIDKLTGVRRLLTKLQFLMELPARLRQCVVEERFGDAIRYYEGTKGVLERFKTTEGFGNLEAQIEESMDEIRAQLQARLREPRGDEATVREARDLLLELGRMTSPAMASAWRSSDCAGWSRSARACRGHSAPGQSWRATPRPRGWGGSPRRTPRSIGCSRRPRRTTSRSTSTLCPPPRRPHSRPRSS
eukprot:COSAG06_NODE_5387_length_3511_cov_4.500000_1_plen_335_part_00